MFCGHDARHRRRTVDVTEAHYAVAFLNASRHLGAIHGPRPYADSGRNMKRNAANDENSKCERISNSAVCGSKREHRAILVNIVQLLTAKENSALPYLSEH